MPHRVNIISAKEYIRSDVSGRFDLESSMKLLREIAAAHAQTSNDDVLLDVRCADGTVMSGLDIYELVILLRDLGLGQNNKVAILYQPRNDLDRARLFEMLAHDRGLCVAAFQDFEKAYEWLIG
jgi:hypothetical protein